MKLHYLVAGIDVSKDTLDICYNGEQSREHYLKVSNTHKGHKLLLSKLGVERTFVMESSGPYYLRLAFCLQQAGCDVRVENPIRVKRFIQMQLERSKSDKKDARWLYRYGMEREASVAVASSGKPQMRSDHGFGGSVHPRSHHDPKPAEHLFEGEKAFVRWVTGIYAMCCTCAAYRPLNTTGHARSCMTA